MPIHHYIACALYYIKLGLDSNSSGGRTNSIQSQTFTEKVFRSLMDNRRERKRRDGMGGNGMEGSEVFVLLPIAMLLLLPKLK